MKKRYSRYFGVDPLDDEIKLMINQEAARVQTRLKDAWFNLAKAKNDAKLAAAKNTNLLNLFRDMGTSYIEELQGIFSGTNYWQTISQYFGYFCDFNSTASYRSSYQNYEYPYVNYAVIYWYYNRSGIYVYRTELDQDTAKLKLYFDDIFDVTSPRYDNQLASYKYIFTYMEEKFNELGQDYRDWLFPVLRKMFLAYKTAKEAYDLKTSAISFITAKEAALKQARIDVESLRTKYQDYLTEIPIKTAEEMLEEIKSIPQIAVAPVTVQTAIVPPVTVTAPIDTTSIKIADTSEVLTEELVSIGPQGEDVREISVAATKPSSKMPLVLGALGVAAIMLSTGGK